MKMSEPTYAEFLKKGDLVSKSLAAHSEELAFLNSHRGRFDVVLTQARELTAKQADLTAGKQDVSKQLATLVDEGRKLLAFLNAAVRQHFGNRSEMLVKFGQQPFRSKPRLKVVDPNGQPVKPQVVEDERPDPSSKP
jgi:hypothetical protein